MSRCLAWDFYGGDALGTATHFAGHVEQFLRREGITAPSPIVTQEDESWASVSLETPAEHDALILRVLRPHRVVEPDSGPTAEEEA